MILKKSDRSYSFLLSSIGFNALFLFLFLLDRYFKIIAQDTEFVWRNLVDTRFFTFSLEFFKNTKTALSLPIPLWFIILVSGAIIISLLWLLAKAYFEKNHYKIIFLQLILIGAISNFIDRVTIDGVIDYFSVSFFGFFFPVFNLADNFIVIGVFCWILLEMKFDKSA